jgi:hypothetical protein
MKKDEDRKFPDVPNSDAKINHQVSKDKDRI